MQMQKPVNHATGKWHVCLFSDVTPPPAAGYLEVTDLNSKKIKYIAIPR